MAAKLVSRLVFPRRQLGQGHVQGLNSALTSLTRRLVAEYRLLSSLTPSENKTSASSGSSLMKLDPYEFVTYMKENNMKRCFVVYNKTKEAPVTSHPDLLEGLRDFCASEKIDYLSHEGFFLEIGRRSGALLGAFVWRTNRGQACGGIRLWRYNRMEDYIRDGLRLGYGMGVKSALAGLWAGGGKGVIAAPEQSKITDPEFRKQMFLDYGDFLSSLDGCYIAAEDAGVVVSDLNNVHSRTRYTTCFAEEFGGSGNPSVATGKGIVCAIEAALDFMGMGSVKDKSIVLQGSGNVARIIIDGLLDRDVGHVYAADCNEQQLELTAKMFANKGGRLELKHVPVNDTETLSKECDVLSPNALGNVLNEATIPNIKAKIVCGAANNQLGKPEDNKLMVEKGITYVVDFLCNRMGIVNCANETYGRLPNDPAINRHFDKNWKNSIWVMTQHVLRTAKEKGITPVEAASEIAEKLSMELHPIWPNRSQEIIDSLVQTNWHEQL